VREACGRGLPYLSAAHGRHGSSRHAIESLKSICPRRWRAEGDGRTALWMASGGLGAEVRIQRCVPTCPGGFKASR
jgi:hypothetical protein